ncbi:MAG: polysaccharide deacetylase [Candidatus Neomarinimicrobiota bacterium]|nr:MAG: polysaccharide deacetylase [Candidatus Neomarinimicrobiota bacterium]
MTKRTYAFITFFLILVSSFFTSCYFDRYTDTNGGVVISFDDRYMSNWVWTDSVLSVYDWKATFFVHGSQNLTSSELNSLLEFKTYGHEIAGHGFAHLNAPNYVAANGMKAYVDIEIIPMINIMKSQGLEPLTFAYPEGAHTEEIDDTLLTYFSILRLARNNRYSPEEQICYYENSPVVNGLGIEGVATQDLIDYFLSLLEYARNNNKVMIFYAHRAMAEVTGVNQTDILLLKAVCEYVRANKMRFYTLSELSEKEPSKIIHYNQSR